MKLSDDLMESTVLSSGVITAILPNLDIKKPSHVILNGEISPSESSPDLQSTNDYEVSEEPLGTIKSVRIITIGAGLSGINMAQKAKHYLKNAEHVIYEKNPGIGGTWYENIYKGCKCDIPSHNYQFAWEPNPNWKSLFSAQDEICEYLQHCVNKYQLNECIKVDHEVISATWEEERGIWHVEVRDNVNKVVIQDRCNFLINGGGILNNWKWPSIPGLHSFKGKLVHSANWPKDFIYTDLTVAVIGNGSTGIQIVPAIQPDVKQLIHLIRSPTWVTPGAVSRFPSLKGKMPEHFSEEQKQLWRENPGQYMEFRKAVELEINGKFKMLLNGAEAAETAKKNARESMLSQLGSQDSDFVQKLIPDFPIGCRRITPGVGYLESFLKPNVRVIIDATIERVDEEGLIMSNGEHIKLDALICATGFDVSFNPRFPITGRGGISLQDVWGEPNIPEAYLSMCIPKFPNYFVFLGPNAPVSHGSVFTITEQCSKYVLQFITKAQTEGIKAIDVQPEAVREFSTHVQKFMPRTAWAGNCRSWFKNGRSDGPITAIHPGSRLHWFHMLERPKFEDFNYTYQTGNRFQYLGNGFSTREEPGEDQTWYLDEPEPKFLYY